MPSRNGQGIEGLGVNLKELVHRNKADPESVYNTWFIDNETRMKAFRCTSLEKRNERPVQTRLQSKFFLGKP